MAYKIVLAKDASEDLRQLDAFVANRLAKKIVWYNQQPDPLHFAKPMSKPAAGDIRFRVGDYRLIAIIEKDDDRIVIVKIGHRRDIYRN